MLEAFIWKGKKRKVLVWLVLFDMNKSAGTIWLGYKLNAIFSLLKNYWEVFELLPQFYCTAARFALLQTLHGENRGSKESSQLAHPFCYKNVQDPHSNSKLLPLEFKCLNFSSQMKGSDLESLTQLSVSFWTLYFLSNNTFSKWQVFF